MKLMQQLKRQAKAFTVVELVVSAGIAGLVSSAAFVSVSALQKGFTFCSVATSTQTNQLRLIDSLAIDLRNSTASTFTTSNGKNTFPVTLTIPKRYGSYEASGVMAGDPGRAASRITPLVNGSTGKVGVNESITVTYGVSTSATNGQIVTRSAQWTDTTGSKTASRQVASFDSGATISFQNSSGGLITSKDKAVVISVAAASARSSGGTNTSTLTDTVFLRAQSLK